MSSAASIESAELRVAGKINLFLLITGRRANGYHELATLFVPLPQPCDVMSLSPMPGQSGVAFFCDSPLVDRRSNTVVRAYETYAGATGFAPSISVCLRKGIPTGAGLGGGSADGAAMLSWLQRNNPHPLEDQNILSLAARIGADVPFFLKKEPCLALGIGEKLLPMPSGVEGWHCVLICPHIHVDTSWAYAAWDAEGRAFSLTEWEKIAKDIPSRYLCLLGRNDFEHVVFAQWPKLSAWKGSLLEAGAEIAGMSGSGSAIYGMFRDESSANAAAIALSGKDADIFGPFRI